MWKVMRVRVKPSAVCTVSIGPTRGSAALYVGRPTLDDPLGWRYAFLPLALGPVFGVLAMARLRAHPRSVALAGGRR